MAQDAEQAVFWLRKAVEQGHVGARKMLGEASSRLELKASEMKFSVGTWDEMFGERITIEVPDQNGNFVKRSVTKKWFSLMQETGRIGRAPMSSIRVHMLHPAGHRTLDWVIGKDVKQETVNQFRDPQTGDLYAATVFEEGSPKVFVMKRSEWEKVRMAMDQI